jgi:hypothetical protein
MRKCSAGERVGTTGTANVTERTSGFMTVQTLKLAGREFVIVPKQHYRKLERLAAVADKPARKPRRLNAQDRGDIAEAVRRRREPARPYSELRKELGLA